MKLIHLLLVSIGVSGYLSLPVLAGLSPPSISGSYFSYVSGLPDSNMRATTVGTTASFDSAGNWSLFRTSSGVVGGEAQTDITVSLTPSPNVVASSHVEGSGKVPDYVLATPSRAGLGGNGAGSSGRIDYQVEVTGPTGSVGLNVDGMIGLSLAGGAAVGSANASITVFEDFGGGRNILADVLSGSSNPAPGQGDLTLNRVWYDNTGLLHSDFTADYLHNGYHETGTYLIQTGQLYTIRVIASTGATYAASYAGADGTFTANAYADPVLSIDAGANSSAYQLLLSEGAGNAPVASVPEPNTLMIAGLAVLGGLACRRRAAALK